MEVFKEIKGYPNYVASSYGYIKSIKTNTILKPTKCRKTGYSIVSLCNNGLVKTHLVHRVILSSFVENIENKPQVNHKDGVKTNNRVDNLEWNTRSENQIHSINIGLRHTRGENNSQCKLSENEVLSIFKDERPQRKIAKEYGVSNITVCNIKKGYSWTHITGLPNKKKIRRKETEIKH
jgi:hypothetical protein